MIVTCPSCNAKYRVRDDAVPTGGAQLKCPECETLFLAHRPAHTDQELATAIERLTALKDEAEGRVRDLEKRVRDLMGDADRQKAEFRRVNEEAGRAIATRDREVQDLRAEVARLREEQRRTAQSANDEIARMRAGSVSVHEVNELKAALVAAQRVSLKLTTDLERAQALINGQRAELDVLKDQLERAHATRGGGHPQLEAEVKRLREELELARATSSSNGALQELTALYSAVSPMLWGLDQAIRYMEPFAPAEPTLAAHVRQLQLLAGVLKRLADATERVRGG